MSDPVVRITFIIPVKNDANRLRQCLESIARSGYPRDFVERLVADNGSIDGSVETARSMGATVLALPGLRVSAVRNRAAAAASGHLLAFVDADHEISPAWIASAVDALEQAGTGAVGALCVPPPNGTNVQRLYGVLRGRTKGRGDARWLGAGNLVVRREVFDQLNGFDELLETCEDVDLCQRIRAAGWRLVADERLVNVHLGDPATLRSVFTSERWRGRDNLRVSFRGAPEWRDWPGILFPLLQAASLLAILTGSVAALFVGARSLSLVAAGAALLVSLSGLRAVRMIVSGRLRRAGDVVLAFAVAFAYDMGRAWSLLLPAGHGQRRRADVSVAGAGPE